MRIWCTFLTYCLVDANMVCISDKDSIITLTPDQPLKNQMTPLTLLSIIWPLIHNLSHMNNTSGTALGITKKASRPSTNDHVASKVSRSRAWIFSNSSQNLHSINIVHLRLHCNVPDQNWASGSHSWVGRCSWQNERYTEMLQDMIPYIQITLFARTSYLQARHTSAAISIT